MKNHWPEGRNRKFFDLGATAAKIEAFIFVTPPPIPMPIFDLFREYQRHMDELSRIPSGLPWWMRPVSRSKNNA